MSTTSRIPKRPAGDRRPRARRAAGVRGGDPGSAPTPTTGHATAQPSAAGETRKHLKPVPAVIDLGKVDLDELDLGSLSVEPGQHLALNGRGAVGAGPVDPLALGLFGLVRNDCHADRLLVWQELASTLDGGLDDDARLGLAAARVCCEHLAAADPERDFGVAPLSEREYDAWWRADEHRRRSWPSVSSLRRWLGDGSWFGVLDRLGQMPGPS